MTKIKELFFKFKEFIVYTIFGLMTTVVSWGSYSFFVKACGFSILYSNALSWICAVLFAFVTNKHFVFMSQDMNFKTVLREFVSFVGSRAITGVLEIVGVPLLVEIGLSQTIFGVDGMLAKVIVSFIVSLLNYLISKLLVFRNTTEQNES